MFCTLKASAKWHLFGNLAGSLGEQALTMIGQWNLKTQRNQAIA